MLWGRPFHFWSFGLAWVSLAERMRATRFVSGRAARRLRVGVQSPFTLITRWGFAIPERLLIAPQDIRTSDPTIADDIYAGHFSLASRIVNTHGQSPFVIVPPSQEWEEALHGFGWLRHLRAADTALSRANGRALVEEWIDLFGSVDTGPGWTPAMASRRLIAWLSQSPLILENADRDFYRKLMKCLGWHGRYLQRAMSGVIADHDRLIVAMALMDLSLCAQGLDRLQKRALKWLTEELRRQILPDGGHIGRNPQVLVDLLVDLLPLRQAFVARGIAVPAQLIQSIDRMMPMLRMFRHADGSLALFNGMGNTPPDLVATVLAYDDARTQPIFNAPHSGYQRLEANGSIVIMETGSPPPVGFSHQAHAGCLSFEFSAGQSRLIVNCGAPRAGRPAFTEAARSTPAHSTLILSDSNSSRIVTGANVSRSLEGLIVAGPSQVPVKRISNEDGVSLEASHDGYQNKFGVLHHRRLTLAPDGSYLFGEDKLSLAGRHSSGTGEYVLRFHLHPSVQVQAYEDQRAVQLVAANGEAWLFHASGQTIAIDQSIFFAAPDGVRPTMQLVVSGKVQDLPEVKWALIRQSQLSMG
jgi:uncharacterized heparinase superfamily protein